MQANHFWRALPRFSDCQRRAKSFERKPVRGRAVNEAMDREREANGDPRLLQPTLDGRATLRDLVLRHARIDAVGPGEDAAGEVARLAEARLLQERDGLRAAGAGAAVHDDLV